MVGGYRVVLEFDAESDKAAEVFYKQMAKIAEYGSSQGQEYIMYHRAILEKFDVVSTQGHQPKPLWW